MQRLVNVQAGRPARALQTVEEVRECFVRLGIDYREFVALIKRLRVADLR